VLSSDSSISFDFERHDPPDQRDPLELLIGEGIKFDGRNRASPAQRLGPARLGLKPYSTMEQPTRSSPLPLNKPGTPATRHRP
jgi:hypothetical protein